MDTLLKLYLARHPRPVVAPGLCYGASDVPVAGDELANVCAALSAAGLPGALPVYSSPLRRCLQLARRLRPQTLHVDARLSEMDFGRWEMRPWSEIARAEVDAWAADLLRYRPGGGECVLDVARRVAAFLDHLRQARTTQALLVCHAGTMRLLATLHAGLPLEQAALQAAATPHHIDHGQLVMLEN